MKAEILVTGGIGLLFAIGLAFWIIRSIKIVLYKVRNITQSVFYSSGQLSKSASIESESIQEVTASIEEMLATIQDVATNASKVALALEPQELWHSFSAFGLAQATGSYFPGEAMGKMPDPQSWRKLDRATLAYGYGVATTALQLARAYSVLANGGILRPISFIKTEQVPIGRRVYSTDVMKQVLAVYPAMMSMAMALQKHN